MELPKSFEANAHEDQIYKLWEESGFFNPDNILSDEPYSIMMPPPNVTGVLHLGHALENTLMDIQARYQRMRGKKVLLLPGTDHAAVATQARVEDMLKKEGMQNPRQELGREGLLEKIRAYANASQGTILQQIHKMGTSADWSRLAYTFDEDRSTTVNTMFIRMFQDGLIYRGYRVVNWSVKGQSTCSDDELVYIERPSKLYTFKYSKDFPITIATTRPETKLGDTAVAVHPDDARYQQYIGKQFTVDVGAAEPLTITVIADKNIDPAFGTGALGVTSAHSQIDYEMYLANPQIGLKQVIGLDGKMTAAAGANYVGLTVDEARAKFVEWLRAEGLLEREEDIMQNVGTSDRFKDIVEAVPMKQWFVAVDKEIPGRGKTLKQLMREAVGDKIQIVPERFEQTYFNWIDHLRDWNISRQIWWGHRIPAWHRNGVNGEEIVVGLEQPAGEGWMQDEDTLDTWFSSGTWTFSTLGWPEQTADLRQYHPTSWITMGHEILFFWMARMILMSGYALEQIPFHQVYIHGILRDKAGKKFSKSSGNGIDPLQMIEQYGTDALRVSLIKGITPGNDARFYEDKVLDSRNFVTKIWNVARFVLMNQPALAQPHEPAHLYEQSLADRWFASRLAKAVEEVTDQIEHYQFSLAAERGYDFLWHELADWYLEINKFQPNPRLVTLGLETVLKLLHPFAPFVTEAIWQELHPGELLMMAPWPKADGEARAEAMEQQFAEIQDVVTQVRNLRAQYKIPYTKSFNLYGAVAAEAKQIVEQLCKVQIVEQPAPGGNTTEIINASYKLTVSLGDLIDVIAEKKRLEKELAQVEKYIASQERKLGNKEFTDKAPVEIVEKERANLEQKMVERTTILEALENLQ